jgi:mevalonate kinase
MNFQPLQFYSHGKLLITGEYLVMYGAQSLAVPVKYGQFLKVNTGEKNYLKWEAFILEKPWFNALLSLNDLEVVYTSDEEKSGYLKQVLLGAKRLNPHFLNDQEGYCVTTNLEYPQEWGLGSSSTFISNLASWAAVDPFKLYRLVASGSGYDLACARSEFPIIYQIQSETPSWQTLVFQPSYIQNLYLLYLGHKQNTAGSVSVFRNQYRYNESDIAFISDLTHQIIKAETLDEAIPILKEHEGYMSEILNIEPIKQQFFNDFQGEIKSLGAWGGDFALVASHLRFEEVKSYFRNKGFDTLFKFDELIINGLTSKS